MKSKILLSLFVTIFCGCGSTKSESELATELAYYNDIKNLVSSKSFRIDAESAFPIQSSDVMDVNNALLRQTENVGGRISLSGNEDFLSVKGNTAKANMSYFGELRTAGYSDSRDTSIIFDSEMTSIKITENDKKQQVNVNFKVSNDVEQFIIKMVVFSNRYANISIYGSSRTAIRYRGPLKAIE
ncbi:DUF4251 domain-containing protein [Winogradskyella sp.]|uniref:DUF4251 domain-containing protein n=1 Tax=Winogradskyella sp. TaxID=1883156 RepID=UPI003F6B61D5